MIQSNTSDFHFSWNQMPNAIGRSRPHPANAAGLAGACCRHGNTMCSHKHLIGQCDYLCAFVFLFMQEAMKSKHSWYCNPDPVDNNMLLLLLLCIL